MKRILMLSTGGTIASTDEGHGLTPTESGRKLISVIPELETVCDVAVEEVLNLDSSNMQPEDWLVLARRINDSFQAYDGIVITHGTDTMAYTASVLSFLLQHIPLPVVLTGSQLPMSAPETDGKRNLLHAFLTACREELKGVYVVFDSLVIRGIHSEKVRSTSFRAFESLNAPAAGYFEGNTLVLNPSVRQEEGVYRFSDRLDPRVMPVHLIPGFEAELLRTAIEKKYRAVVIRGFGLGGIPAEGRDLNPVIRELDEHGIVTVITTQCTYEGADISVYGVGVAAGEAGAVSAGPMTFETAVAKLMWLCGTFDNAQEVKKQFTENIIGEWNLYQTGEVR